MFRDIPSDQLAIITEVIRHLDQSPLSPHASRRKAPRCDVRTAMSAILLDKENHPRIRIFTRNISTSGIGFVSRRPFKPDERIAFDFNHPNAERKIIIAKVTFVRYVRKGMYEIGAEFLKAVRESEAPSALRQKIPNHL